MNCPWMRVVLVGITLAAGIPVAAFGVQKKSPAASQATGSGDGLVVRPGPPPLDDFESDEDGDGVPDAWYNARDVQLVEGGVVGPTLARFEAELPSRPARMSRGFGVDGRQFEAIEVSVWVKQKDLLPGERIGEEPGILIDLLDAELQSTARIVVGPWTQVQGEGWLRWSKRYPVPTATRDAILTTGLLGGTGTLELDGLALTLLPVGGETTTNLVVNGGFELGGLEPDHWLMTGDARRGHPGSDSDTALRLSGSDAKATIPLGLPVRGVARLRVAMAARVDELRGAGGAQAGLYFLDETGQPLPGSSGSSRVFRWGGSAGWKRGQAAVDVPIAAVQAVLQVEKTDARGSLWIDDVQVTSEGVGTGTGLAWTPGHEQEPTEDWAPYEAATAIEAGSALDFSHLLTAPAGKSGPVRVDGATLKYADGTRARFLGVSLFPPVAFQENEQLDRLADQLARSGVNLVRLSDLDMPLGLAASLVDDAADDTVHLDPDAMARLDHLLAALKQRGIAFAIELQGQARFRNADGVLDARSLKPGGGPASAFLPAVQKRLITFAKRVLEHVNPETGVAIGKDPALAWVTLGGEQSLFDLVDDPEQLSSGQSAALRETIAAAGGGAGRRAWQRVEQRQWGGISQSLRDEGFGFPIAASAHWRREPEYNAMVGGAPFDLVDDRLFWPPPRFGDPNRRTVLLDASATNPQAQASRKRRSDRPYVVGQYASYTEGAWALPFEGSDLIYMALLGRHEGWDALVRRGVARYPELWGKAPTGTGGGADAFLLPEAINGNPQVFAVLPHAASIFLAGGVEPTAGRGRRDLPGWDRFAGRLQVDLKGTQGVTGRLDGQTFRFEAWDVTVENRFGIALLSSRDGKPVEQSDRLLMTVIGRAQPTGMRWVDAWRRTVSDPGHGPILLEPMSARVSWKRAGGLTIYPLSSDGSRLAPFVLANEARNGFRLPGPAGTIHWELVVGKAPAE